MDNLTERVPSVFSLLCKCGIFSRRRDTVWNLRCIETVFGKLKDGILNTHFC